MMILWQLVSASRYTPAAYFDPRNYHGNTFPAVPQLFGWGGFNPSIALLPRNARFGASARFIASSRAKNAQCRKLDFKDALPAMPHSRPLAVLDDTLSVVAFLPSKHTLSDVRLETHGDQADRVIMTGMLNGKPSLDKQTPRFEFNWLVFENTTVRNEFVEHPDIQGPSIITVGRNYGVIWDGLPHQPFNVVHWILKDSVDVRRGIPPPDNPLHQRHHQGLHNAGSPVRLDRWCHPRFLLSTAHYHLNKAPRGATGYGNTYMQKFVAFRDEPPYDVVAESPSFCFPSIDNTSLCETIQFVGTVLVLPDSDNFLITYGINDCESAYVNFTWSTLLAFFNSTDLDHHCAGTRRQH